jgi:hypothetical protein
VTRRFAEWWKQGRVSIRYHADGDFFRIWIADAENPAVEIELENRSQGFQWFFSFYLVFLGESGAMSKDAVLLLDCPGTHLHPTAQRELIGLFERLAEAAPLVYSTHSPFLVDGAHLSRLCLLFRDEHGRSRISSAAEGAWPADRNTLYPLQAAAGYAMIRQLLSHERRHLLVGELSDYFYLQALNLLCRRSRRTALAEDIQLTPCGGAGLAAGLGALFMAEGQQPVLLLGAEEAQRLAKEPLLRMMHLGAGHPETADPVLAMDAALGKPGTGTGLEDLIGELHLLGAIDKLVGQHLLLMPADRVPGGLVAQVRAAATRLQVALPPDWKVEVARQTAADWTGREADSVPAALLDAAAGLFANINTRFGVSPAAAASGTVAASTALAALLAANGGGAAEAGGSDRRYDPKVAARLALARGTD